MKMYIKINERVSHKFWRRLLKKEQRRLIRRKHAQQRDQRLEEELAVLTSDPYYLAQLREEEIIAEEIREREEKEAQKHREEWIARDLALHSLWLQNEERKRKVENERKLQEDKIRKEWEEKEKREEEARKKTLEAQNALLAAATRQLGEKEATHNPEPPAGYIRPIVAKAEPCPFFAKTGACRFGVNCSREHYYPERSRTLLFPNMYTHFGLQGALSDDYDTDISLEYTESDSYLLFREFFFDVLPEFEKCGKVVQFKVCSNRNPHLRGNVYVQFETQESAEIAVGMFNGRWYAGRQISCVFVQIERWKPAICGLNFIKKCPKGDHCNFLHVYRNPGNAFYATDRDLPQDNETGTPKSDRRRRLRSRSRGRDRSRDRSRSDERGRKHISRRRRNVKRNGSLNREAKSRSASGCSDTRKSGVRQKENGNMHMNVSDESNKNRISKTNSREAGRSGSRAKEDVRFRSTSREAGRSRSRSREAGRCRSKSKEDGSSRSRSKRDGRPQSVSTEDCKSRRTSKNDERLENKSKKKGRSKNTCRENRRSRSSRMDQRSRSASSEN